MHVETLKQKHVTYLFVVSDQKLLNQIVRLVKRRRQEGYVLRTSPVLF